MIPKVYSPRRFFVPFLFAVSVIVAAMTLAPALLAQESTVQIDPAQTRIEFSLGGAMHTVHGKFDVKSSAVRFDPASGKMDGAIVVDSTSGGSGNGSRDARMHREILESAKFPEIIFTPVKMTGVVALDGSSKVEVSGRFRLHGQDHDVTLPVDIESDGKNLRMVTHIDIPYVQWGLKNPSNFFLRVSNVVAVDIHAAGRIQQTSAIH